MKAVVGVDQEGLYVAALSLLGRLKFPGAEVELIHTDEPLPPYPEVGFTATPEIEEMLAAGAKKTLEAAAEQARTAGLTPVKREYVTGPVTLTLMLAAEESHADMIAIGSHQKSRYGSFFLGSVGRGLTISSKESILIAKGPVASDGPLTAIFATDYSTYAKDALRALIAMRPAGLARLVLLTAVAGEGKREPSVLGIVERGQAEERYAFGESQIATQELESAGIACEVRIIVGDVHECIGAAFRESGAELLIMGAHGHGFFERLVLGSTSLRESLATHHPVLILRPR